MTNKYSEFTENIISTKPPFIVRYGIIIFTLMLFIITVFTWFIQYPEIIIANGKLVNTQSPKTVLAHTEGKLKKLMVFENDSVQKQQIIGYMETLVSELAIADLQSKLITLKKNLRNLKLDSVSFLFSNYFNTVMNSNMGEIQNSFETFMQAYNNFKDYLPSGFYMSKKSKILQDISRIKQLNEQLKTQKSFLEKDLVLSKENIKANESLLKDKIISAQDYRNEQSKLIAKQMSLPQIKLSIIQNDNACNEKHKEIDEIVHQEQLQLNNFMQSILTLQSTIALWEFKNVIKAPISGRFHFVNFIQDNQDIKLNESIGYVTPPNIDYFVSAIIPQDNFGKIKIGQQVILKFPAFPYEQYGILYGKLIYINPIPTESGYLCKIILPNGLTTQYNKQVIFTHGLIVQANIITKNSRLIERFYYSIMKTVQ